jgi:hypothetical protein
MAKKSKKIWETLIKLGKEQIKEENKMRNNQGRKKKLRMEEMIKIGMMINITANKITKMTDNKISNNHKITNNNLKTHQTLISTSTPSTTNNHLNKTPPKPNTNPSTQKLSNMKTNPNHKKNHLTSINPNSKHKQITTSNPITPNHPNQNNPQQIPTNHNKFPTQTLIKNNPTLNTTPKITLNIIKIIQIHKQSKIINNTNKSNQKDKKIKE